MKHRQFNTIVAIKVKLAEKCKTAMKKTKTEKPLKNFSSQEGSTPSPSAHPCHKQSKRKYRDWGRSHRKTGRMSRVSNERKGYSSSKESK